MSWAATPTYVRRTPHLSLRSRPPFRLISALTPSVRFLRSPEPARQRSSDPSHFAFGNLNTAQWLQFVVIHDNHYQKIIRDVLKARSDRSVAGAAE